MKAHDTHPRTARLPADALRGQTAPVRATLDEARWSTLQTSIDQSPRMLAQRRALQATFGNAFQYVDVKTPQDALPRQTRTTPYSQRPALQRKISIGGKPLTRQHQWILDDLDAIRKVSGMSVSFTAEEKAIVQWMRNDNGSDYDFEDLAKLITFVKQITGSLTPPDIQLLKSVGLGVAMFHELLAMNETDRAQSIETISNALPAIHAQGYFVERILESGSTKPMVLRDIMSGTQKVLKLGGNDPRHIRNEVLSNKLYEGAGALVVKSSIVEVGERDGMFMDFLTGVQIPDLMDLKLSEDFRRHIAVDFLLGNWDIVKLDNWVFYNRRYYRLDNGGALVFRAQGSLKSEAEWGRDDILEMKGGSSSMTGSRSARENPFFNMDPKAIAVSAFYLFNRLSPGSLASAVDRSIKWVARTLEAQGHLTGADSRTKALAERILNTLSGRITLLHKFATQQLPFEVKQISALNEESQVGKGRPSAKDEVSEEGHTSPAEVTQAPLAQEHTAPPRATSHPVVQQVLNMVGGFLLRRASSAEAIAFRAAAASQDARAIRDHLFVKRTESEVVFSVNYLHIFKKEGSKQADNYDQVIIIPITDALVKYLAAHAYFHGDDAERSAPRLKPESERRGLDLEDAPNVLIKRTEIIEFWNTLQEVRFISGDQFATLRPEYDLRKRETEKAESIGRERWEKSENLRKKREQEALSERLKTPGGKQEVDTDSDLDNSFFSDL